MSLLINYGADDSARRKFAPDDFWVMSSQMDLQGFVEAAVYVHLM